jgi:hypothetical protein
MSYASIDDLKAATGDDQIAEDDTRALRLLEFADAKINEYCGQTFPIEPSTDVPLIVVAVAAAVAGRAWTNPAGAVSTTDTAGPSSLTNNWGGGGQASPSVPLALRASEKDDLARYKVRRSGIGTIATENPISVAAENYVQVAGGGKPFPWPNPDAL